MPEKQFETAQAALKKGDDFNIIQMPSLVNKEDLSPEESAMKEQADKQDEHEAAEVDEVLKLKSQRSVFKKLMAYNNPKIFVLIGIFGALIAGSLQPGLGIILSQYLGYVAAPIEYLVLIFPNEGKDAREILERNVSFYGLLLAIIAVVGFVAKSSQVYLFGILSNKVTHTIR